MFVRRLLHNAVLSLVLFCTVLVMSRAPFGFSDRFETYVSFVLTEEFEAELLVQGMRNLGSYSARWEWLDWLRRLARTLTAGEEEAVPAGGPPSALETGE